ncbi:hypothetical protein [Nonomuraea sp. NPDC049480]|uniref:hypothetical protein n=1 Tax=Nonomuraea sp. NPDC049480 TaxID=3364353 RepID=UPI00379CCAFB
MTPTDADAVRIDHARSLRQELRDLFRRQDPAELLVMKAGRKYALRRLRPHLIYLVPAAALSLAGLTPVAERWPSLWWWAVCVITVAVFALAVMMAYWSDRALRTWSPQAVELASRDAELILYCDDPAGRAARDVARFFSETGATWPIRVRVHYPYGVSVTAGRCTDMPSLRRRVAGIFPAFDQGR